MTGGLDSLPTVHCRFDVILAGDDVTKKKPDPLIYNMARERLGIPADRCVVIEDSLVGLRAAVGAGMRCIITPSGTSTGELKKCARTLLA
jgi:HAD superfamily hydrolase (TIGR01509 family)